MLCQRCKSEDGRKVWEYSVPYSHRTDFLCDQCAELVSAAHDIKLLSVQAQEAEPPVEAIEAEPETEPVETPVQRSPRRGKGT